MVDSVALLVRRRRRSSSSHIHALNRRHALVVVQHDQPANVVA
jgi:hypothetical protein